MEINPADRTENSIDKVVFPKILLKFYNSRSVEFNWKPGNGRFNNVKFLFTFEYVASRNVLITVHSYYTVCTVTSSYYV